MTGPQLDPLEALPAVGHVYLADHAIGAIDLVNVAVRAIAAQSHIAGGREIRGLNERFRYYRYTRGQRFAWHHDGYFERSNGERSLLSFLIYLNEGYEGGATKFEWTHVRGKTGMGLLFPHGLVHEGSPVLGEGVKYVIRTDVMYAAEDKFTEMSSATYL